MNALRFVGVGFMVLSVVQILVINVRTYQLRSSAVPAPRLLWYHIMLISIREIVMSAMITSYVVTKLTNDEPPSLALPLYLFVGVVGNAAFWVVLKVVSARAALAERVGDTLGLESN